MSDESNLLLPFESYEENAVNIGTQQKSADMARFIERVREDGLYLLDVNMTDSRVRSIAQFLNKFDAARIQMEQGRQGHRRMDTASFGSFSFAVASRPPPKTSKESP